MGHCYADGLGVTQDWTQAFQWYRKAADLDLSEAQYNVALCYENGEGTRKDATRAMMWYAKAVQNGYTEAVDSIRRLGDAVAKSKENQSSSSLAAKSLSTHERLAAVKLSLESLQAECTRLTSQHERCKAGCDRLLADNSHSVELTVNEPD